MRIPALKTVNSDLNLAVHTLVMRYWPTVPDKTEVEETAVIPENKLVIL
jgi:hypothetical protein